MKNKTFVARLAKNLERLNSHIIEVEVAPTPQKLEDFTTICLLMARESQRLAGYLDAGKFDPLEEVVKAKPKNKKVYTSTKTGNESARCGVYPASKPVAKPASSPSRKRGSDSECMEF